ncbi:MAG: hypothetical protein AB1423_14375 [Pseudomonadota bacterium]
MGIDYAGQEKAIEEIRNLSQEAKEFLSHHLRNALNGITGGIEVGRLDIAKESAMHMVEDLERIGC